MAPHLNTSAATKLPPARNATADKLLVAASELMIERNSIALLSKCGGPSREPRSPNGSDTTAIASALSRSRSIYDEIV